MKNANVVQHLGWGARYAILFTHASQEVQVDAVVAYHPSGLSIPSDINPISKPVKIIVGDKDAMMSVSQIEQAKELFTEINKDGKVKGTLEIQVIPDVSGLRSYQAISNGHYMRAGCPWVCGQR